MLKPSRLFRKKAIAALRWLCSNAGNPAAWSRRDFLLLFQALERGDLAWPQRVSRWVRGCDVLDIGCGRNLQGIGFLAAGARSYTGLDPTLDLDSTVLKDSRQRWSQFTEGAVSPRTLMSWSRRLRYAPMPIAEFSAAEAGTFDTIVMHNVTEHLMAIGEEFERFAALLRPGGRLVFRHPNYYCWHGHHLRPRTIHEIDPADPEQAAVVDWAHVRFDATVHAWIGRTQNRIRLDELRALTERHFAIERWEETDSPPEQGIARLTPEIVAAHPEFSRRELAVKCAFVVAAKR